ncbi:hypothetical protein F3Y22_tig00110933pilonHSYRG00090 [Hibiscus syriacus]|uniref:Uncharacterized protein n=1 Tax=Hibiscus syriacus TaxID=106335 RepID=A0A6A2ZD72_HIBSY|nr:hypothetical protein F3Y22_tig00110933pilonHSYRG00090 [Hibiscus syriacus]
MEKTSYFVASKHKLNTFFSLIFRSPTSYHPLLASAVSKRIVQNHGSGLIDGKDENTVLHLIKMINSDNRSLVEQACSSLPIETIPSSPALEDPVSVLHVVVRLAYMSDTIAQKMLTADVMRSLQNLFEHQNPEVQRLALLAVGNLAFCKENRHVLVTSNSLREHLVCLTDTVDA